MLDKNLAPDDEQFVRNVLLGAGWFDGRQISTIDWVSILKNAGIHPFEAALAILSEFGGLRITARVRPDALFSIQSIDFDPVSAGVGEEDRVHAWSKRLNQKTYPIGECDGFLLIVAEDGGVFWEHAGGGRFLGPSIWAALRLLLIRSEKPVPYPLVPVFFYNEGEWRRDDPTIEKDRT